MIDKENKEAKIDVTMLSEVLNVFQLMFIPLSVSSIVAIITFVVRVDKRNQY